MDLVQGIREAALQADPVERICWRRKLQDHAKAWMRRVGCPCRVIDLAARQRRAAADGTRRQLALLRERPHDLGAHPRKLRSIGADAAVAGLCRRWPAASAENTQ